MNALLPITPAGKVDPAGAPRLRQEASAESVTPPGAMLVPNALRERLLKYAGIAEKSHGPGRTGGLSVVGTAARLEKGRIAGMLAEKLFGETIADEDEALRRVGFSRDFWLVWVKDEGRRMKDKEESASRVGSEVVPPHTSNSSFILHPSSLAERRSA